MATTAPPGSGTATSLSASSLTASTTTIVGTGLVDGLPAEFVAALGQRPVVVLFYVPGGVVDERVLRIVQELRNSFRQYTFLMYDYRLPAAYGDLAELLGITNQPQIVLMDRHADTYRIWSGYVDKGTLNQSLINLGRE